MTEGNPNMDDALYLSNWPKENIQDSIIVLLVSSRIISAGAYGCLPWPAV